MSEKNLTGQMNMFDLYEENNENSTKVVVTPGKLGKRKPKTQEEAKPVEEVKPQVEADEIIAPKLEKVAISDVVMQREITDSAGRIVKSVSYINYNKVRIITNYDEEKLYEFEDAKEAVDFYVDKMQHLKKL